MTGLYGVVGVLLALRAREATGTGPGASTSRCSRRSFRVLDELAPAFQQFGFVRERMGADTVNVVPHSHYECSDGTLAGHRLHERRDVRPAGRVRWAAPSWPTTTSTARRSSGSRPRPLVNALVADVGRRR